ncbi:hypothetical protein [Capillimicrobium parvum]|uniref:DUF4198 domain-containing protein n=1 Tax=Capillimicrobium parvum TaxID=2884022 RepID=A0A9E6XVQ5_9ACTN|nr:hypothetical protein [Capillimicrobium parvum]UGS35357.1 hypothetical protein DSM104329_01745 [Capillimicrobium parvum]
MHLPLIRIATAAAAALAMSVPAAVAAPANQATIDIDDQNMTANGFAAGSGWTRVTINADRPVDFGIVALKPGKDTGGFANAIGKLSPDRTESWGDWVAGGSTRPGAPYVVALDMDPAWYSVIVYERKKQYQVGGFSVFDRPGGFEEPASTSTIGLRDFRFDTPRTLDAGGTLKVVNQGRQIHELVLARVKGKPAAAVKLAKQGKFGKIRFAGQPSQAVGLVSGGTTNVVTPELAKGRYLLVCAYGDARSRNKPHATLGMAQAITVR